MQNKVICLAGPTAAGKTALALKLAERYPIDIISVDSALVYQGFNIGTSKPTPDILALYPHHLVNICSPTESYSAARFCRDATTLVQKSLAAQRIPLLVGGTMMYFHSFLFGLAPLPPADRRLRARLAGVQQRQGLSYLYECLIRRDPKLEMKIHPHDQQRIIRGLEICLLTQKPWSQHIQATSGCAFETVNFMLWPTDRSHLHQKIAHRFQEMLKAGWLEEVRYLIQHYHLTLEHPSLRMVGYRQIYEYLQGMRNYDEMIDSGIAATRKLAKRQITWLRKFDNFFELESEVSMEKIVAQMVKFLDLTI